MKYFIKLNTTEKIEISENEWVKFRHLQTGDFLEIASKNGITTLHIPFKNITLGYTLEDVLNETYIYNQEEKE